MRVMVSGAGGFIGRALVSHLAQHGRHEVVAASRMPCCSPSPVTWVDTTRFGPLFDWSQGLDGVEAVVHLAGRAHVIRENVEDPEGAFLKTNRDAARRLAEQAVSAGVRQFVLVSTIGVHGDSSSRGGALTEADPLRPYDPYTRSKAAGERAALDAAAGSKMKVTILRPPMVYGPDAPGNFSRLVRSGIPLPFGGIDNARSLIALDNLVDLIGRCLASPPAIDRAFVVADGVDFSTPELIRTISRGVGARPRLLPCHVALVELALRFAGRASLARRLCGSLRVDASLSRQALAWKPVVDPRDALERAAHETGN
jgi:nucleoside-diphosphate-sugar epimerase